MAPSLLITDVTQHRHVKLTSFSGLGYVLGFLAGIYVVYYALCAFYQIYLSPLRSIPSKKSWVAFPFLRHYATWRGDFDAECRQLFESHKTDAIRIAPGEILFNSAPAWQEIYGHGRTPQMQKKFRRFQHEPASIVNADDVNHTRFRKALSHAFSDRALREQESMLQNYVSLLIERLGEHADRSQVANMTEYYNFATFDIIVGAHTFTSGTPC
jgi:hypothetical protein